MTRKIPLFGQDFKLGLRDIDVLPWRKSSLFEQAESAFNVSPLEFC